MPGLDGLKQCSVRGCDTEAGDEVIVSLRGLVDLAAVCTEHAEMVRFGAVRVEAEMTRTPQLVVSTQAAQ